MGKQYKAVIQAGGKGTRMLELTGDEIPKPMLVLEGKPMIRWQVENIRRYGIRDFVIITGHLGEKIEEYFGDGSSLGVHIRYIRETSPLGSAGALRYLKETVTEGDSFLFVYADVLFDIDWNRMVSFYESVRGQADAVLLVHPNSHPADSDLVVLDGAQRVTGIVPKNRAGNVRYENCVNAGVYILSGSILQYLEGAGYTDLEQGLLAPLAGKGRVFGYRTPEYVKDAGTPARFRSVGAQLAAGIPRRKNLENRQKCVFLAVCWEGRTVPDDSDAEAVRMLNASEFLVIVVMETDAADGTFGTRDGVRLPGELEMFLGERGAYLDDIVFRAAPWDTGTSGKNASHKTPCDNRKQSGGLLEQMAGKYNIDLNHSWLVGDTAAGIQTGRNAGVKTVLVRTGRGRPDGCYDTEPDVAVSSLKEAVEMILNKDSEMRQK